MKPTEEQIRRCVLILTETIPFAPKSEPAQMIVERELTRFVASTEGLEWIEATCIATQKKWPGLSELRGLYCAGGFSPLDGIRTDSETPNYTPKDLQEARQRLVSDREKAESEAYFRQMEEWRKDPANRVTDQERAEWAELARKLKLQAAQETQRQVVHRQINQGPQGSD